ncbi:MAG: mobile mystery protein A [Rhodothermia bacterium]|nr:MAG: mobile mystery protein A [Rhodothermia bacterium]
MSRLEDLRTRQLDETLEPFRSLRTLTPPEQGWARTIRDALGMSLRQLAERTGKSKTTVASAEAFESKGTVQLDSLRVLANGLDCDLIYALVPRDTLRDVIDRQAERIATRLVTRVSDSMELESQGVGADEKDRQIKELKTEILQKRGRDFWNV